MLRLVQSGEGAQRAVVLVFLVDKVLDNALRESLGPKPCIVADNTSGGLDTFQELIRFAHRSAGTFEVDGTVLVGYSAGCQRVRALLLAPYEKSFEPIAVVCADGTHASLPAAPWQIEVWKKLAARARTSSFTFAASHTFNTYVETDLKAPYMATVSVLCRATGFALDHGGPVDAPILSPVDPQGRLFVYSYASSRCDRDAHEKQGNRALPMMLKKHVREMLESADGPATHPSTVVGSAWLDEATPAKAPSDAGLWTPASLTRTLRAGVTGADVGDWQRWLDAHGLFGLGAAKITNHFDAATVAASRRVQNTIALGVDGIVGPKTRAGAAAWPAPPVKLSDGTPLWQEAEGSGARALRWALQFAGREDLEDEGANASAEIADWLRPSRRRATDKLLNINKGEWCAAFFCASSAATSLPGDVLPYGYRASGIELIDDAKDASAWRSADLVRAGSWHPAIGDGCIFTRNPGGWETHVCRVVSWGSQGYWTFGGNEANTARLTFRRLNDPALLGFVAHNTDRR